MAGAIIVSRGAAISMATWAFDYLAELIRVELQHSDGADRIPQIFHGKDEAFMNFIAIDDEEEHEFNCFYRAAESASKRATSEQKVSESLCEELLATLRADPRFVPREIHPA